MEALEDQHLKEILGEWHAPQGASAPRGKSFCPTDATLEMVVALVLLAGILFSTRRSEAPSAGLANFQPVKELNLRVIRSNYEQR